METGQQWPPSVRPHTYSLAARATCAPGRSSRHGAACIPWPTATVISSCQAGWNSTSSIRWPYRSCVRSTGGCSLASRPHSWAVADPASLPTSRTSSSAQPAPSRRTASSRAGSSAASNPSSGGTWLKTSWVGGIVASGCRSRLGGRAWPVAHTAILAPSYRRVQLGAAVGQQVVVVGDALVAGAGQVAVGGQDRGAAGGHGTGQRVAVRADDDRPADPLDAALGPPPVRDRDEHAAGGRVRLRLHHLGRPLARGPGRGRPVDRGRDQVGAVQGGQPRPLRELQVVADTHGHPAERQGDHGRGLVAGGEHELLPVPQVRLAVDGPGPGGIDQGGAVVEQAVPAQLTEPTHDRDAGGSGQLLPLGQGGAAVGRG